MGRLFGGLKMSWPQVIVFAIIVGVYTGAVMLVPALYGTSFQDIGISYEWWVIFAVIIVVNCDKGWEAALKCFAFFFISQPLVFAVEVIFGSLPVDLALMYYRSWFIKIILTLPGGFILHLCKRQDALGATVLGLANTIQAVMAVYYIVVTVQHFPYHLLSALVAVASVAIMTVFIQEKGRNRLIALLIPVVLTVALLLLLPLTGRELF